MKKALAFILAFTLMFSACFAIPSTAVYESENYFDLTYPELYSLKGEEEIYPTIILPGINHSPFFLANEDGTPIFDKKGNEISATLLMLNTDSLAKNILNLLPNLFLSLFLQKDSGLSAKLEKTVNDLMTFMKTNSDGSTVNHLVTKTFEKPVSEYDEDEKDFFYTMLPVETISELVGEENLYLFTFPLFGDPMDSMKPLDDYIDMVLKETGAEKVNLASVSLGGTILTAYAEKGNRLDKINKVVNMVSLLNGTDIMGDFIDRDFNVTDEFLRSEYLPLILDATSSDKGLGNLINIILHIMPQSLFNTIVSTAYGALHDTVMMNCPEFWAMVPKERYEGLADKWIQDSALRAKTDEFHKASCNLEKNLAKMAENGTEIYSLCGYNLAYTDGEYAFFGIVSSNKNANSDGIIPISSTSIGATAVKAGTTFSDEYLSTHSSSYISPDKSVDASTCLFPNRTWFFSGQHHEVGRNDVVLRLAALIISGAIDSVQATELFPQFNGSRVSRSLIRCPNGKLFEAIEAMQGNKLNDKKKDILRPAYENALKVINSTICDAQKCKDAEAELTKAMEKVGLLKRSGLQIKASDIGLIEKIDKALFEKLKGKGFIEGLFA